MLKHFWFKSIFNVESRISVHCIRAARVQSESSVVYVIVSCVSVF